MKFTMTLSLVGMLLFLIATTQPFSVSCFHCAPSYSIELGAVMLGLSSLIILASALLRLLKYRVVKQINSNGPESMLQFYPYEPHPPLVFLVHYPISTDFAI